MLSSWQIASHFLSIEKKRASIDLAGIRLYPAFVGFLNLFFCAYMEQYIRSDSQGNYLSIFFLVEFSVVASISVGTFMVSMTEIIVKSSVFPLTPMSAMMFVFAGFLRKPVIIALMGGTILFIILSMSSSLLSSLFGTMLVIVAFLVIESLVAVACLRLRSSAQPVAGIALLCVCAVMVVVLAAVIFHVNALLDVLPIVSWTVKGILLIRNGAYAAAGVPALELLLALAVALFLGKKITS